MPFYADVSSPPLQQLPDQFPESLVRELGEQLSVTLMPPIIWQTLLSRLDTGQVRLRLRVRLPALESVPWEYVYLPGQGFLCLHRNLYLVRCVEKRSEAPPPEEELRVLIVAGNSSAPGYPALPGVDEEMETIREALLASASGTVSVEILYAATPASLQNRLRRAPAPHVVHFVGHSDVRPSGGFLVLHGNVPGSATPLFADQLAQWLPLNAMRLMVLASCLSAGSAQGIAETLVDAGVPAVLAMQTRLRDQSAPTFACALYSALAAGEGMDTAVWSARKSLLSLGAHWGAPVLFLNSPEAELVVPSAEFKEQEQALNNSPHVPNHHFVGRQGFLLQVHRALSAGAPVALVGLPGVGKTQVAAEYARTYAPSYAGGVFWLDASSSQRLIEQYVELARRRRETGGYHTAREQAQAMRGYLSSSDKLVLVVLDNLTDAADPSWIPEGEHCRVLVTTKQAYLAHGEYRRMSVTPLGEEPAVMLLQSGREARDQADMEAARQIAALVGYLPLALSLVASHVARLGCSFAEYLHSMRNPLDALRQARYTFESMTGHDGGIHDAFAVSYRALSADAQEVLQAATAIAAPTLSVRLLRSLCTQLKPICFEQAIDDLVDVTLLTRQSEGRLYLHELVRLFVEDIAGEHRLQEYRLRACSVLALWFEQANAQGRWERVREEIHTARVLLQVDRGQAPSEATLSLTFHLAVTLSEHCDYEEAVHLLEAALSATRVLHPDEPMRTALCMKQLGYVCEQARLPEKALDYAKGALHLAQQHLPPGASDLVEYLTVMGYVLKMTNNLAEARGFYDQALQQAIAAHGREHPGVATLLNNLGTLHEAQGDFSVALEYLQQAQAIDEALFGRQHTRVAIRLNNMGRVLAKREQYASAMRCHQEASAIYEKLLGERSADFGVSLFYLGDALRGMRDIGGARAA